MAFVTLEDRYGEIEIVVFPKILERCGEYLHEDSAVAVTGRLSTEEDSAPKIVAEKLITLSGNVPERIMKEAVAVPPPEPERQKTLYLRVPSSDCAEMKRITALLSIFPGETPVVLYDSSAKKYAKSTGGTEILPNMISLMRAILGEENVVIK